MKRKIILVDASPRKGGNCEVITDRLAAELSGADVTVFKMREKNAQPCLACGACQGKGAPKCVQRDDFAALVPALEGCDAIVLAAPIYFGQMCAQAKMFIDRLYCFFNPAKPAMSNTGKRGKKAAFVCTFGGGPAVEYAAYAEKSARSFSVMGADSIRAMALGGLLPPGAVRDNAAHLAQVSDLAKWLAE